MRNGALLLAGLAVGLIIGYLAFSGAFSTTTPRTVGAEVAAAPAPEVIRWKIAGSVPASLVQIGTLSTRAPELITRLSGGRLQAQFFEPNALVPPLEMFDSVSTGAIDAGFATAGYWVGKVPSLAFFSAVPFGPQAGEYMAWFYHGGGEAFYDEIYGRHNIKGVLCGIIPSEASGWFRDEIATLDDLKGLKMRFFGLGGEVLEKLGVSTQLIAAADIYPALELGTIDATEFSMPAIDMELGFHEIAKHYYFPGWHQQSTFVELIINLDRWRALPGDLQTLVETVCGDNFRYGIAEGEALQFKAIRALQEKGVIIHKWPPEMIAVFEKAWQEVVAEKAAGDADFARVWASLKQFREDYALWRDLGNL